MPGFLKAAGFALVLVLTCLALWRWEVNGPGTFVWIALGIAINLIRAPHARTNAQNVIIGKTEWSTDRLLLTLVFLCGNLIPFFTWPPARSTLPIKTFPGGLWW